MRRSAQRQIVMPQQPLPLLKGFGRGWRGLRLGDFFLDLSDRRLPRVVFRLPGAPPSMAGEAEEGSRAGLVPSGGARRRRRRRGPLGFCFSGPCTERPESDGADPHSREHDTGRCREVTSPNGGTTPCRGRFRQAPRPCVTSPAPALPPLSPRSPQPARAGPSRPLRHGGPPRPAGAGPDSPHSYPSRRRDPRSSRSLQRPPPSMPTTPC